MSNILKRTLICAATLALALCVLYFAGAQAAAEVKSATQPESSLQAVGWVNASDRLKPRLQSGQLSVTSSPNSSPFTVTATNPAHQALNVPFTSAVTAAFSADVNASTVTTATFVVQAMQSGLVTGTFGYAPASRTVTLTAGRPFHAGEVVRGHLTAGILGTAGGTLQPYQWQFTAGRPIARAACDFRDADAGLTGVRVSSAAWGDYDNDGRLDILLTGENSDGTPVSKVYHNDGAGVFTEIAAGLTGVSWGSAAWGDYDNDGRLDILLTGGVSTGALVSRVYHNDGNGVFTAIAIGLTGVNYSSVAWGDFNNDGRLDIVLMGYGSTGDPLTELWQNQGAGSFTRIAAGLPNVGEGAAAWGDYDNDGYLDLVLMGYDNTWIAVAAVWRNQGNGSFTRAATLTGISDGSAAWGDYDGDGDLDLLVTGYSGGVAVSVIYRNDGNGVFTDIQAGLAGVAYSSAAWGDYDNDGDLDVLLSGAYTGSGAMTQAAGARARPGAVRNPVSHAEGDIATADNHLANGVEPSGGLMREREQPAKASAPERAAFFGVYDSGFGMSAVYRNDGGVFTPVAAVGLMGLWYGSAGWGDYDGDGDLDILLTGRDAANNPVSKVYRNNDDCGPDLTITKSATPSLADPGAAVTYTLAFSNVGGVSATAVVISDRVPVSITAPAIVSSSGAAITQTGGAPNFTWQAQDLAAGQGGVITITGVLSATLPAGAAITNTAEITSPVDGAAGNNRGSATVTVQNVTPPVPPLVSITCDSANVTLSWADNPANAGGYVVWYSTEAYFQPAAAGAISVTRPAGSTSYVHSGAVGDGTIYFYLAQGVNGVGTRSAASNQVGMFGVALTPGAP